jgi:hypothetical protein
MHPQSANLTPKNFPDARCDGSFSANARNGYSPRPMARQKNPCLFLPQQNEAVAAFLFVARDSRAICIFPVQKFYKKAAG